MIKEVAFVAYPVTDMARSRKFYEGVLGLTPSAEMASAQWVEYDLGGTTLGLGQHPAWNPSRDGASVGLEVDDFDAACARLKAAGVTFTMEPFETPVCHMAMFLDPDNSCLMLHKRKANH